jgi:hypothetical protein
MLKISTKLVQTFGKNFRDKRLGKLLGKRLGEVLANFFHTFKLTLVYRNTEY